MRSDGAGLVMGIALRLIFKLFVIFFFLAFDICIIIRPLRSIFILCGISLKIYPALGNHISYWIPYFI